MNKTLSLGVLAGLMVLASCSNEETDFSSLSIENRIIPVSQINQMSRAAQNVQTGSNIESGVQTGFFITDGAITESTEVVQENILGVADGNGGFTSETQLYFPLSKVAGVYAYAPYQVGTSLTSENAFNVALDQSKDEDYLKSDLIVGMPQNNPVRAGEEATQVSLKFDHLLSKVNLNVNVIEFSDVDISDGKVKIMNVQTGCIFQIMNKTVTPTGATGTITATTQNAKTQSYECAAIIVPQTIAAGKQFLCIEANQNGTTRKLFVRLDKEQTFVSGHEYTYNVTIKSGSVEMSLKSELNQWTTEVPVEVVPEEEEEDVPARDPQIGDWYTAAGKFVDGKSQAPDNAIGIVFSTAVSEAEKDAGYKAYVSALSDLGNTKWAADGSEWLSTAITTSFATTGTDAVNALNGLALTESVKNGENFADFLAVNKALSQSDYAEGGQFAAPAASSGWFVPSVGQMALLAASIYEEESIVNESEIAFNGGYARKGFASKVAASYADTNFLVSGNPTYWTISESDASSLWQATFSEKGKCSIKPASKAGSNGKRIHLILAAK